MDVVTWWVDFGSWVSGSDWVKGLAYSKSIIPTDKRIHRHTFGAFLLCWPCRVVVRFDKMFGSEEKRVGNKESPIYQLLILAKTDFKEI